MTTDDRPWLYTAEDIRNLLNLSDDSVFLPDPAFKTFDTLAEAKVTTKALRQRGIAAFAFKQPTPDGKFLVQFRSQGEEE